VRDRDKLRMLAGDAYGLAEELYRKLIAPFVSDREQQAESPAEIRALSHLGLNHPA